MADLHPDTHAHGILAAIVESSNDAIIGKDLAGRILTWNRGAEAMYGFRADEMVGRSIGLLIPPDRGGELERILMTIGRGEPVAPHHTVRVTRSGHRLDVSLAIAPIYDAAGHLVGASSVARDITAQRHAERELRSSEARWRAVIDAAVDGIIVIDALGTIESFNAAAERLFGYRAADVIGRNVSMLMPPPYAAEHDHYLKRYAMTGARHVIGSGRHVSGRRQDGSVFPIHLSVGQVELEGVRKFTGIIRDLSEQAELESKIREEAGLVRIGELAAVLAHEVRNPLAAVSGAIQMLRPRLPEEDREIASEILRRIDGLDALMTDLLLYARPPRPQMREVEVAGLLDGLVLFLKADPAWRDLDIAVQTDAQIVRADPELLKIAFQNLLLNAAQATGPHGRIGVTLHTERGGTLSADVADSGPGIPEEAQARLFTPFFTTKARGTGLGLATARRIAEAHGGTVEVRSTGPAGTVMRLSLAVQAGT